MDIKRLDFYFLVDIASVAKALISLKLKEDPNLQPEQLVSFICISCNQLVWKDPKHPMYEWLLEYAQELIFEKNVEALVQKELDNDNKMSS